jgi:malonyl-CoA/methylmalonyl-CoA synthetase
LPLFHVHGLILHAWSASRGGVMRHPARFSAAAVTKALSGPATVLFAVPTMYHRLAQELPIDPALAKALARARLLVSVRPHWPGDHERIAAYRQPGGRAVRHDETLMNCSVRTMATVCRHGRTAAGRRTSQTHRRRRGTIAGSDSETIGEVAVRGPNLFWATQPAGYHEVMHDGWFHTGDPATWAHDGYLPDGAASTDLIKSGGFKIGEGEIENVLLEHSDVAEVAVTGYLTLTSASGSSPDRTGTGEPSRAGRSGRDSLSARAAQTILSSISWTGCLATTWAR